MISTEFLHGVSYFSWIFLYYKSCHQIGAQVPLLHTQFSGVWGQKKSQWVGTKTSCYSVNRLRALIEMSYVFFFFWVFWVFFFGVFCCFILNPVSCFEHLWICKPRILLWKFQYSHENHLAQVLMVCLLKLWFFLVCYGNFSDDTTPKSLLVKPSW